MIFKENPNEPVLRESTSLPKSSFEMNREIGINSQPSRDSLAVKKIQPSIEYESRDYQLR